MSTIRRAAEKARREREQRTDAGNRDETLRPILRPVPVSPPEEPANAAAPRAGATRSETGPLQLPDGHFGPPDEHLVSLVSPDSMESEHYQTIRFTLEQGRQKDRLTVIAVSSASAGEGKTLTTLNLAGCLARGKNTRVLVIDGDLRKPSVAAYLGMRSRGSGLSDALVRPDRSITDVARFHRLYNFAVVPSGEPSNVPYELFSSPQMQALLTDARRHFDFVFVDLPPILFPECRVMAQYVDGFVMVVAAHRTSRTSLQDGLEQFDTSKILGLVFNADTERSTRIPSYYRYGYARS